MSTKIIVAVFNQRLKQLSFFFAIWSGRIATKGDLERPSVLRYISRWRWARRLIVGKPIKRGMHERLRVVTFWIIKVLDIARDYLITTGLALSEIIFQASVDKYAFGQAQNLALAVGNKVCSQLSLFEVQSSPQSKLTLRHINLIGSAKVEAETAVTVLFCQRCGCCNFSGF